MVLTNDGALQHKISHPDHKMSKTYWVQVEGACSEKDLEPMRHGLALKDGMTLPISCGLGIGDYAIWPRNPPIRVRKSIPDTWLTLTLQEGRNRQVRRMCAHLGFPVLRLIRYRVGSWTLDGLEPGQWRAVWRYASGKTLQTSIQTAVCAAAISAPAVRASHRRSRMPNN